MASPVDVPLRRDWDARARHAMRLYVATWYAHSDETWAEGTRRDAACLMAHLPADIGPGDACLDLGCGAGRLLPALAARFERVTGVDVSPGMLAHARDVVAGEPRITLRLSDGISLAGLPDAGFRFVLANAVFIHCHAALIARLLAEVSRVLAPGGLLAATFRSAEPPPAPPAHERAAVGQAAGAVGAAAPLPPPSVTAADLALMSGPSWDGACFTRAGLLALLRDARLVPTTLQPMDTAWNVVAARRR
jgi:SAM-dependent methyltransferase